MTLEEQRALAIECGAEVDEFISFSDAELATYTAAVKAKERTIIANWAYKVGSIDSEDKRLIITGEYKL